MNLRARQFAYGLLLTTALTPAAGRADELALPPPLDAAAVSADSADLVPAGRVPVRFADSDAALADTVPAAPAPARRVQLAQLEMEIPPPVGGYQPPVEKPAQPMQDSLQLDIERSIQAISAESAPSVRAGLVYRTRPGQSGLSQLDEVGIPIEGRYSPGLTGTIKATINPLYLAAGSIGSANLTQFGANELLSAKGLALVGPGDQNAGGVIGKLGYSFGPYSAEIGESAIGFPVTNFIGSVAYQPRFLNDELTVRLEGSRTPVTDSLLSYAGARTSLSAANAATGNAFGANGTWGGVVKTGGHIAAYYDNQSVGAYAGAGLAYLSGTNVPDNGTVDALLGAYFRPYKSADDQVRVGINLVYFGFDKNLSFYSFGQGGYFSPQNYEAVTFPVEYQGRSGRWSYLAAVGLGVQHFNQRQSPFFPNNPAAEQALIASAGSAAAFYPGHVTTGLAANLRGQVEYALDNDVSIGAAGSFNNGHDYNEGIAKIYIRKTFSEPAPGGIIPQPPRDNP